MEKTLGPYILKELVGKGGMGEVYRAFDTLNGRQVALKVIKQTLLTHPKAKARFLQEAHINALLSHPSIIAIYSIYETKEQLAYSMPFIEGHTLKTHLLNLRKNPRSTPLKERLRHFIKILEAVSFTHKKGYLHRDIKADNILIGENGETLLFDWGLACPINEPGSFELESEPFHTDLTRPGKIPGTLTHLAPERALGSEATIQSDLFSLGVVLYQLLTLQMPFYRKDIEAFKRQAGKETFELPSKVNLLDEIDEGLDWIIQKALSIDLNQRYKSADEFKADLQKVLDGLPVWKNPLQLELINSSNWLFQDLLPLGDYVALNQKALTWGILSVPYVELLDNYKLIIKIPKSPSSFKIYLDISAKPKGFALESAFILDVQGVKKIAFYRFLALLEEKPLDDTEDVHLTLEIEKIGSRFFVFQHKKLIFQFASTLPRISPYIGFLVEDETLMQAKIELFHASSNKQISCLKLGDNLLFHKEFALARDEYEKIYSSFADHEEGRLALFRKGYSYILEAQIRKSQKKKLLHKAIAEFETFRNSRSAPWEYWGKALAYEALGEKKEVLKCFELCFRKYKNHPFTEEVKKELVVLFSQKSMRAKKEALSLALIALRYLDDWAFFDKYPDLIASLDEELSSIKILFDEESLTHKERLIFSLAYILKQPTFFEEILFKDQKNESTLNAALGLIHLKSKKMSSKRLLSLKEKSLVSLPSQTTPPHMRLAFWVLQLFQKKDPEAAIFNEKEAFIAGLNYLLNHKKQFSHPKLSQEDQKILEALFLGLKSKKSGLKKILKSSFYQESDRFIRTNFLISLLDKKPIDYFGYDKEALEFTLKTLY